MKNDIIEIIGPKAYKRCSTWIKISSWILLVCMGPIGILFGLGLLIGKLIYKAFIG